MPGRLAVDFGTSNTVVAVWDDTLGEAQTFHLPELGSLEQVGGHQLSLIPSLIHYADTGRRWLGQQVHAQDLYHSPRTFRWMKRYIGNRSPVRQRIDGKPISHFEAGSTYLTGILVAAAEELNLGDEEIALTVPVESYEHYENWLSEVTEAAGLPRFRVIDEPSAAALGYNAHIQPGDVYLVFDFGGGTLDVAAVLLEESAASSSGRRCRVLGKAGVDLGGTTIDQWLFQEVLKRNELEPSDDPVRQVSNRLLNECMMAKERLSIAEHANIAVTVPDTGDLIAAEFTRQEFEQILAENEAITMMEDVVRRTIQGAEKRGYSLQDISAVLMVGGSCQIPCVQRLLKRAFGQERVLMHRPMDAVARGAASFVAGVDFFDYIQHDYALGYVNREKGTDDYLTLVEAGTPYPSEGSLRKITVKAHYDGQTQMGLKIFELGEKRRRGNMEMVFDMSGIARIAPVKEEDEERRTRFWMNENNQMFLTAEPPGIQGQPRFEVEFFIDANKRLLITARDLFNDEIAFEHYPVVKLT